MRLPEDLRATADAQHGLLTRAQLGAAGVSPAAVRWRLGRQWRLVLPSVVSLDTGRLDPHRRLVAASLYAGPGAVLSGSTAARWHGVGSLHDDGVVRLEVPWSRRTRTAGFAAVRRTARPEPHPWRRGPLLVASPARAVVAAAREQRSPETARALVIEAVQRRLVRLDDVEHEVEAGATRGSALVRRAVAAARTGAWSYPEHALLDALSASTVLPRVWPNPQLVAPDGTPLPSPDGWVDDVGLAYQVHSREFHSRDDDWESTVAADTRLGELGVVVLGITPRSVARDPGAVVRRVERAYLSLLATGRRPDVVMRPRLAGSH